MLVADDWDAELVRTHHVLRPCQNCEKALMLSRYTLDEALERDEFVVACRGCARYMLPFIPVSGVSTSASVVADGEYGLIREIF